MKKKKGPNYGLLNQKRFEWLEKEKVKRLQKLTVEEKISIMEGLLDSGFVEECKRIQKELGIDEPSE